MTIESFCIRCGRNLPPGSLKYVVDLRVYAGFDGYLPEEEGDIQVRMKRLVEEMEVKDEADLEGDVYLRQVYLICKDCRDRFLSNPLNIPWSQALG
jgi:hypothetical protein